MIQMEYKREMDYNYLLLDAELVRDYRIRMLTENKIKGLLPIELRKWNGEERLYYNITSRQSLGNLYGRKELEMEDIRNFFYSLEMVSEELKKYLLDWAELVFYPESCFMNPGGGKIEWIYLPGNTEGLLPLAEFMVEKVNHKDIEATSLVYRFHSEVRENTFCLAEFISKVKSNTQFEPSVEAMQGLSKREDEMYGLENRKESNPFGEYDLSENAGKSMGTGAENTAMPFYEKVARFILSDRGYEKFFGRKKSNQLADKEKELSSWENFEKKEGDNFDYFEDEDRMNETVVWSQNNQVLGILKSLTGKGKGVLYEINSYPCVIGKMKECSDVIVEHRSVSRMHARISKVENEYFIEDLNSKNGTRVNGFPIEGNEKVKLSSGDEIAFAEAVFIFE